MPARRDPGTIPETKLARVRISRGVTQEELANAIGISVPTYRRIERGQTTNPGLRYLMNAAIALGVKINELIEDEWSAWFTFDHSHPEPPEPHEFWRRPYNPPTT
jgi:transcriptional regulator with XRE-family HTH domain